MGCPMPRGEASRKSDASRKSAVRARGATRSERPAVTKETSSQGASRHGISFSDNWLAYRNHHWQSAVDSIARLAAAPFQSLLTCLVIAIALTLPATFLVAVENLQAAGSRWDSSPKMTLFLHSGVRQAALEKLQQRLGEDQRVESFQLVSPDEAMAVFTEGSGVAEAIAALNSNPLPYSIVLTLNEGLTELEVTSLRDDQKASRLVDQVLLDQAWMARVQQYLRLGQQVSLLLGALLLIGVILVVGNTLRLAIEARRDEIVIIKLVGATNAFVRRPILYSGGWYGLGGGFLALLLLNISLWLLSDPVNQLASLYNSNFQLSGLGIGGSLLLLMLSVFIGWAGALLAVGRHLDEIKP